MTSAARYKTVLRFMLVGLTAVMAISWTATASAQDQQRTEALMNRLDRMERDLGTLSRQVYGGVAPKGAPVTSGAGGGVAPSSDYVLRLESRISDLENQITQLTGNVETLSHSNSELTSQLERMSKDYDVRFQELEKGGAPAPGTRGALSGDGPAPPPANIGTLNQRDLTAAPKGGSPTPAPQQRASLPQGTPQQQYDYAYGLIEKARSDADYSHAAQAFQDFLEKNPSGPLASNARYWMGETYYVRKDYNGAARVFLEGYQKDQKGPKAPDTLLKLGMSLTNLDKKKEACATFDKLAKDFPDASGNIKRVLPRERQRASCA